MVVGEDDFGVGERFAEAVELRAHFSGEGREEGEGVVPGIAFVDDDVEPEFGGEFELLGEDGGLGAFFGGDALGRAAEVVEAGLADGHDARALGEGADFVDEIGRGLHGVVGMDSNGGEDVRVFLRERDCTTTALDSGADGDDARHARLSRAGKDTVHVVREIREREVRVGVDEHGWC